jgi:hypothetical protein
MELTDQELRKLRDGYNVQKKTQARRKPDRKGHRIKVTMTFEEWLQVWTNSGKLHLRGKGSGKFCMARKDDLGDYTVGNVEIKSCEQNSREGKLGRPGMKGRASPTRGMSQTKESNDLRSASMLAIPHLKCPHCAKIGQRAAMSRHHMGRCRFRPSES